MVDTRLKKEYKMASLAKVSRDEAYDQMTVDALTSLREKLKLTPAEKHGVVPSHLEPPVWDVQKQQGICPRSGKEYKRENLDVSSLSLLPTHFRLFPSKFLGTPAPFNSDFNGTLCRFLRARDYDVDKAYEMVQQAIKSRELLKCDSILNERDTNEIIWQNGTPHYHYGHDKLGRPFYIELSGKVRVGKLMPPAGVLDRDDFKKRHVIHMEYMCRRIEHASKRFGGHVSQLSQIMDLEGLSYFGDSRGMTLFKDALEIDQNTYPEYLGNLFLINAPFIFRGMWAIIKGWIDPKTAAKFVVLGSDYKETLLKYIDIDQLPIEYGGRNPRSLPVVNFDNVPGTKPKSFDEGAFVEELKKMGDD